MTSLNMYTVIFKISGMSEIWSAHTCFWANVYIVMLDDSDAILTETLLFLPLFFKSVSFAFGFHGNKKADTPSCVG